MSISDQHRAAAYVAIQKIAEVQEMHAEFTLKCDELFRYAQMIRNADHDTVRGAIYEAVGDTHVQSGIDAQQIMLRHEETVLPAGMALIEQLKMQIMHDEGFGATVEAVASLERYAQGF